MKSRLLALCLLFCPGLLHAGQAHASQLQVPEQFDVLVVNGEEFPFTIGLSKTVPLIAGRNVIVLEYDKIFDAVYGDSHDRVKSAPFAVTFSASAGDMLVLHGPEFDTGTEAKRYAKAPTVQIRNAAQQSVAVQLVPVKEVGDMLVANVAAASAPTPVIAPAIIPATAPTPAIASGSAAAAKTVAIPSAPPAGAHNALEQLNYWWQQATPEQRAAFLQSIVR